MMLLNRVKGVRQHVTLHLVFHDVQVDETSATAFAHKSSAIVAESSSSAGPCRQLRPDPNELFVLFH